MCERVSRDVSTKDAKGRAGFHARYDDLELEDGVPGRGVRRVAARSR